jgi:uncharacterized protein (TIGR03118 family)
MKPFASTARTFGTVIWMILLFAVSAPAQAAGSAYQTHSLVSDGFVPADHVDPNLANAWGIAFNATGPVWISDNGTNVSTLYDGQGNAITHPVNGVQVPLVVQIPGAGGNLAAGPPTGIVFNGSAAFEVSTGNPSRFIFATEDGVISGWSPSVDLTHAVTMVDNSPGNAVYKGLALGAGGGGALLYAADFHNARVDVFDGKFAPVTSAGGFSDPSIPAGFAPFGIQAIAGDIYVTYAMQDAAKHDDVKGPGLGFVDVFDGNGHLIRRLVSHGRLNAPWGLALAPAGFGRFGGRLLVGNFGDGTINAYDLANGRFAGRLRDADRGAIRIDGLWGIAFGNGFAGQSIDALYFTAGPGGEAHGLYGRIDTVPVSVDDGDEPND